MMDYIPLIVGAIGVLALIASNWKKIVPLLPDLRSVPFQPSPSEPKEVQIKVTMSASERDLRWMSYCNLYDYFKERCDDDAVDCCAALEKVLPHIVRESVQ